ncbi:CoA transferase [Micromonospora globispora]|uniref:CoA transferase n=1 Tax=Micromonospora globispora TaxID=1450148 RepID=A0A317K794_9ACTN|nr:CoA transferase [Micromonospora globispora]PWU48532.1 CoA transferase [Micromonospora globispora]PWU55161.1 CoA transferase [Micromonospora globispora]RQW99814.1 CoA transferase [Micromonospora globispora]
MSTKRTPPLAGVTVVEIGAFMAAPFAAMQLADLGADVIKVEHAVGGDPVRQTGPFLGTESSPFVRINRNKRSVALDLKSPDARRAFLRLVERADVLVENLRPGAMRRLGLGYEDLREINPRLVYASASGWGQDGPLAGLPGLDIMAQARSGLMSITGHPGGPPAKVGVPICDLVCGLYVALAVTAALRERDRSDAGQYIDVSLYEAGVSFAVWEAGKYFATGEVGGPMGSAHQSNAPYQAVHSSDGYVTIGATTPRNWQAFCDALGLTHLLDDPRYADAFSRLANRTELIGTIETVTSTMSTDEIVERLNKAGVPCAPIADYGEVFTDEHLAARDFFWDAEHPTVGPVRQLGSPMRLSETPVRRDGAGPMLGADTREVLAAVGCSPKEIEGLVASGAAVAADG